MKNRVPLYRVALAICVCAMASVAQEAAPAAKAASALYQPPIIENPESTLIDQEGAGKLYQAGEHLVCVMDGTPEEMGFQQGRLLAKHIHLILKEGYMQKAFFSRGYTMEYINTQSALMEKHFPPEYIAEMKGIVKGLEAAGVKDIPYEDIRLAVTQAEIAHHQPDQPPDPNKPLARTIELCSNFAAWGRWTPDGRLLHGRNLDWNISGGAQACAVVLVWRPKGGTPFMMPSWTGAIGSVSGMNANGITIGEMTSVSSQESFDGLPLMVIMRKVLQEAKTLDEAVQIMQQGPRTTGWNFVIGDGKIPSAKALEVDAVDCCVFGPEDPAENQETGHWSMPDAVRRTNHPCGMTIVKKLVTLYGPQLGITLDNLPAAILLLKLQNTWQRYDWLGRQIQSQPGKMDVARALQLLCNEPVGGQDTATLHSWVFDPKDQTAYLSIAGMNPIETAGLRPYTKIDLKEWFK